MKKYMTFVFPLIAVIMILSGCGGGSGSNESEYPEKYAIGSLEIDGSSYRIFMNGNTVFASYNTSGSSPEYGFYAINASNPQSPSLTGKVTTYNSVNSMAFNNNFIYVVHRVYEEFGAESQWDSKFTELNADTLAETGNSIVFDDYANDAAIANGYVYISFVDSTAAAMRVVNLSTFLEISSASYSMNNGSWYVRINGNRLYLSGQSIALEIVDIDDPVAPAQISSYLNPLESAPQDLCLFNDYALLCGGSYGVGIIDISDEANPAFLEFNTEPGDARKICNIGNIMLIADEDTGVIVVDASSGPDNYVVKGICKTTWDVMDICVSGNYVYAMSIDTSVPFGNGMLEIFDISSWLE